MGHLDTLRMAVHPDYLNGLAGATTCAIVLRALGVAEDEISQLDEVVTRSIRIPGTPGSDIPVPKHLVALLDDLPKSSSGDKEYCDLSAHLASEFKGFSTPREVTERDGKQAIPADDGGRVNAWPHDPATLNQRQTALLVFNFPSRTGNSDFTRSVAKFAGTMARKGFRVFYVDAPGGGLLGRDLGGHINRPPHAAGAFSNTNLETLLRSFSIENLVLAGWGAGDGINLTMRQANDRGFDCLILYDLVCAGSPSRKFADANTEVDAHGLTCSIIRRSIFAAAANSEAVYSFLETLKDWELYKMPDLGGVRPSCM